jgi:hypothetical protein
MCSCNSTGNSSSLLVDISKWLDSLDNYSVGTIGNGLAKMICATKICGANSDGTVISATSGAMGSLMFIS